MLLFFLQFLIIISITQFDIQSAALEYYLTTVAGTGTTGVSTGDGGQATSASVNNPSGIWADNQGNIYFSEGDSYKIHRIDSFGIISSFIGSGVSGSMGGNGGVATAVKFTYLWGLYGDSKSQLLYISDKNYIIWRYNFSSVNVSRYVGSYPAGSSGDGGPALLAKLTNPRMVFLSTTGILYITDQSTQRIRFVNTAGIINTFAGNGLAQYQGDNVPATSTSLNSPYSVWGNSLGVMFIADTSNNRVRCVNSSGIITTIAGTGTPQSSGDDGPAILAKINRPFDIKGDSIGNLFIAEYSGCRIRMITAESQIITTIAGLGTCTYATTSIQLATSTNIKNPQGLWVNSNGNIYFTEYSAFIRKLSLNTPTTSPSVSPSEAPTSTIPTVSPTEIPSLRPSLLPTILPTISPSMEPSLIPTSEPTVLPSRNPTTNPTINPTSRPSILPTTYPSTRPSTFPSCEPTMQPNSFPSSIPSGWPSNYPTTPPTSQTSSTPSQPPTSQPNSWPSTNPSASPSRVSPSSGPSIPSIPFPTGKPSLPQTALPSSTPSQQPLSQPTSYPSSQPTSHPSNNPSAQPSLQPTAQPTSHPSCKPSRQPTKRILPTILPTPLITSISPTAVPSLPQTSIMPSVSATNVTTTIVPSYIPSLFPSIASKPSILPSVSPLISPTLTPSANQITVPSCVPTILSPAFSFRPSVVNTLSPSPFILSCTRNDSNWKSSLFLFGTYSSDYFASKVLDPSVSSLANPSTSSIIFGGTALSSSMTINASCLSCHYPVAQLQKRFNVASCNHSRRY